MSLLDDIPKGGVVELDTECLQPEGEMKMPNSSSKASLGASSTANSKSSSPGFGEVMTLVEAAKYLRVPGDEVVRMAREQGLPARQIGEHWRILKSALQEWLTHSLPESTKEAFLAMAGKFKEDPFLDGIVRDAYRKRGRSATEKGQ